MQHGCDMNMINIKSSEFYLYSTDSGQCFLKHLFDTHTHMLVFMAYGDFP